MSTAPPTEAARRASSPDAPLVVLIHGVGFGPRSLRPLSLALALRSARVLVFARRGYGARAHISPAATVDEHVDDLLASLDACGVKRAVLVGVSGGATVALEAALTHPGRVLVAIAHEPAAGSLAPELHSRIRGALEDGGGVALVRFLIGEPGWARLTPPARAAIARRHALIEADARAFTAYEPSLPAAATDPIPLICALGERSGQLRRAVAERLSARTGAPVVVVPGSGHLPQLDAPAALAELTMTQAVRAVTERSPK